MKVALIVPGVPEPKGRPRFGNGRTYTPQQTRDYEAWVQWHARVAMKGLNVIAGPVAASMLAVLPIPKRWAKARVAACVASPEWHASGKDIDNLLKAGLDACNGIVFEDDSQVAWLKDCRKVYGLEPRLELTLEAL